MPRLPDPVQRWKRIGIVGVGNMGSMMAFAFSELGLDVSFWDVSEQNVDNLMSRLKQAKGLVGEVQGFKNVNPFVQSLAGASGTDRKLFMFSITHGAPADSVLSKIKHALRRGDVILDGGNENYRNTERRQRECSELGVTWIGTGVSGGYQSARHGPSMSPGGDRAVLDEVLPLLELYAAKDPKTGVPCVANMGPRGAGHYVKMVHNGIEGGMMSALSEAWALLQTGLGLTNEQIGDVFASWDGGGGGGGGSGELRRNYLVRIGADVCRTRKKTPRDGYVLDEVLDKVVQDDDDTEGTPMWAIMESAARHVAAPTLAAAHYLRIASGNRQERVHVAQKLAMPAAKPLVDVADRRAIIETLRRAVYCVFLASFCQGLELIARASRDEGWNVDLAKCIQIWRAGCIIQSEYIADLLQPVLASNSSSSNLKAVDVVANELQRNFHALKEIVLEGTKSDLHLPAISATLEYLKYVGSTKLPTQFMEAEMDYFGAHSYNMPGVPGEDPGPVAKGPHHYEWKPA